MIEGILLALLAAISLAAVIGCARDRKKKPDGPISHPQPSNSEATSKRNHASTTTTSAPGAGKAAKTKPKQPPSGGHKDSMQEEEKGERKQKKKAEKKEDDKGVSVRISIHGDCPESSDNDDERPFIGDVFDAITATDDTLPGEVRKQSTTAIVSVDSTQLSSDQPTTTVDPTDNQGTKECTQTGYSTQDPTTVENTRDTTRGDATASERPEVRAPMRRRQTGGPNKRSGAARNKKSRSISKCDPSQTGDSATESNKKRMPRRQTGSFEPKSPRIPDVPSVTHKDSSGR